MRSWFATVRVRTTVFATLVVTIALVIGAILLVVLQRRELVAGIDRSVRSRADDVAALARRQALPKVLTAAREDAAFTQVVDASGAAIASSENLREDDELVPIDPSDDDDRSVTQTVDEFDEQQFRIAVRSVRTPDGQVTVAAGDSLETVEDATRELTLLLGIGLPLLVALVALITWKMTGRALRPVEAIRAEVGSIGERELNRRVPEPPTADEVGRLARTMNAMLTRLDDAADRQRRFVSDASHELQSPLTSLRARLEVNLASGAEPDWRAREQEALLEVTEMQRLVDDLLTLARLEARPEPPVHLPVDIDDLVLHEVERIRTRGRVAVDLHRMSAGQVSGDPDQLQRAVRNVLANAERYADKEISVSVQEVDTTVEVRIDDDGHGIPVEHRDRIFERFGRIDAARTRDGSSTGLGLAITREIVEAHGGQIDLEQSEVGARFVIRLPAATVAR